MPPMSEIYDIEVQTLDGKKRTLADHRGEVMLIVNVASKCGYTPQYEGLEALHRELGERGLAVLGFPCNQFGSQEPGTAQEIRAFCDAKYGVSFPMYAKLDVNGRDAHVLYRYLTAAKKNDLGEKDVRWNFEKFLVDRAGRVVKRFESRVTPAELRAEIERLL